MANLLERAINHPFNKLIALSDKFSLFMWNKFELDKTQLDVILATVWFGGFIVVDYAKNDVTGWTYAVMAFLVINNLMAILSEKMLSLDKRNEIILKSRESLTSKLVRLLSVGYIVVVISSSLLVALLGEGTIYNMVRTVLFSFAVAWLLNSMGLIPTHQSPRSLKTSGNKTSDTVE